MASTSRTNITLLDKGGEAATVTVHAVALTAGNFTAQMTLADAFVAAVEAVSLMVKSKDSRVAIETGFSPALPTESFAQRGIKFLVRARDPDGVAVTFKIPGANLDLAGLMVGESMDLTSTEGLALKDAIEDYVVSNNGAAVTVQEIIYLD